MWKKILLFGSLGVVTVIGAGFGGMEGEVTIR